MKTQHVVLGMVKKVFLTELEFIFTVTFELFPQGNNYIMFRQRNRSGASKQDPTDIIHFEHQFELTNGILCYLKSSLSEKKFLSDSYHQSPEIVYMCVHTCTCRCTSKLYKNTYGQKGSHPHFIYHNYVSFGGLFSKISLVSGQLNSPSAVTKGLSKVIL